MSDIIKDRQTTDEMPAKASAKTPGGFLIVDDVAINILITKEMLLQYNLPVDTAESGREAVDKIEQGNVYDIIFMDHKMPGMDGTEATDIIRSKGYTGCIVALSAAAPGENDNMFLSHGFDKSLIKPLDSGMLDEVVREAVGPGEGSGEGSHCTECAPDKQSTQSIQNAQSAPDTQNAQNAQNAPDTAHVSNPGSMPAGMSPECLTEMEGYFIQDAEAAAHVLEEMFTKNHTFTDEDMDMYEITVHGVKSALRNIGMHELGELAYKLELAAKGNNKELIDAQTPELLTKLKQFVVELKKRQ